MADKIQEPAANLKTKEQIKVKEEKYGRNVVEAQPAKEQKTMEPKETGVISPPTPKDALRSDRDVGKDVADEKIAVARIGSMPCFPTKPDPNSNETTYTQKELLIGELLMKAINAPGPVKSEDVPTYHQRRIARKTLRMPDAMVGVMGGPSKEEAKKILSKARDPYAVATAAAQAMGYTDFEQGTPGQKKRDEIAEAIEAKKAMSFPKHGAAEKVRSAKGRREELDAADRGMVDEEKCSLKKAKDAVLIELMERDLGFLEKAESIAGFQPTADVRASKDKPVQKMGDDVVASKDKPKKAYGVPLTEKGLFPGKTVGERMDAVRAAQRR